MTPDSRGSSVHALFPGTFDPPTLGHLDLIRRAAPLFEKLYVAIADHPTKDELLPVPERFELLQSLTRNIEGVVVMRLEGLIVDGCRRCGASLLVRGVRHSGDFEYEAQMARTNRILAPEIDTFLLVASPEHVHISSTLVRQIASLGGDLSHLVPPSVARVLDGRSKAAPKS